MFFFRQSFDKFCWHFHSFIIPQNFVLPAYISDIEKLRELELNVIRASEAAEILEVNISCVNKLTLAGELTPVSGPGVDGFQYNIYIRLEVEELRKKRQIFKEDQTKSGKSSRFGRISGNRYSKIQKAKVLENKQ